MSCRLPEPFPPCPGPGAVVAVEAARRGFHFLMDRNVWAARRLHYVCPGENDSNSHSFSDRRTTEQDRHHQHGNDLHIACAAPVPLPVWGDHGKIHCCECEGFSHVQSHELGGCSKQILTLRFGRVGPRLREILLLPVYQTGSLQVNNEI